MSDCSGCSPTVMQKKPTDQIKSTNVSPPFLGRLPLLISAGEAVDRKWIRPRRSAPLPEEGWSQTVSAHSLRSSPSRPFGKIVAAGMS